MDAVMDIDSAPNDWIKRNIAERQYPNKGLTRIFQNRVMCVICNKVIQKLTGVKKPDQERNYKHMRNNHREIIKVTFIKSA